MAGATAVAGCDRLPNVVSEAKVQAMGVTAWQEIRRTTPLAESSVEQAAVADISVDLLTAAGERPGDWEVALFADPQVNAFALPGRKIGVYRGMLGVAETRDQLATVIGHEIGHVQAEHSLERVNAQVLQETGMRIILLLLQLGDVQYAEDIAAALGVGVQYGIALPYSRRQELEADRLGLVAMARAGFDTYQAVTFWQNMESAAGGRTPGFLSTHPAPSQRIEELREILAELPA